MNIDSSNIDDEFLSFKVEYSPPSDIYPATFLIKGYQWDEEDEDEREVVAVSIPFLMVQFGGNTHDDCWFQSDMVSMGCTIATEFLIKNYGNFLERGFFFIDGWNLAEGRDLSDVFACICAFQTILEYPPFSQNHMIAYCGDPLNELSLLLTSVAGELRWDTHTYKCVDGSFEVSWAITPAMELPEALRHS